ncbi:MAG: lipid II flippase family protein [Bacillota bacterium]
MDRLWLVVALVGMLNLINTLSYTVHVSGVATHRLATASSLFNVLTLFFHLAAGIQAPLLAKSVEDAIVRIQSGALFGAEMAALSAGIKSIIWGGCAGTVCGILFLPAFTAAFILLIRAFDRVKTVPRLLLFGMTRFKWRKLWQWLSVPSISILWRNISLEIPILLILWHMIVTAVFTASSLAAVYAGFLRPAYRTTVLAMAPFITGIAGVILVVMVEPVIAAITDEAMRGARPYRDVKAMVMYLVFGRLAGVCAAHLLVFPMARFLAGLVRYL